MRKIILHPRSIRSKHFLPWFRIRYYFFIIIIFFFPNNLEMLLLHHRYAILRVKLKVRWLFYGGYGLLRTNFIIRCNVTVTTCGTESSFSILSHHVNKKGRGRAAKSLSVLIVAKLFLSFDHSWTNFYCLTDSFFQYSGVFARIRTFSKSDYRLS